MSFGQKKSDLIDHYLSLVENKEIEKDNNQLFLLNKLQEFRNNILKEQNLLGRINSGNAQNNKILLKKYFLNGFRLLRLRLAMTPMKNDDSQNHLTLYSGVYIFGEVGRGKSMLMDIFVQHYPYQDIMRIHFNEFIRNIHKELFILRNQDKKEAINPVEKLAKKIAGNNVLLCLDEMQINDAADAVILTKLFYELIKHKVKFIITSNRPPEALYLGGIQKEKFLDFVRLIRDKMEIINLDGIVDYRENLSDDDGKNSLYFYPLNDSTKAKINEQIKYFSLDQTLKSMDFALDHKRNFYVKRYIDKFAIFDFDELCKNNLGAGDYNKLAKYFDVILLDNIPKLKKEDRNEAKRFILLIDELYENNTRLICRADSQIEDIYPQGDSSFEFKRTISRIKFLSIK